MANEATIRMGLQIDNDPLHYQGKPNAFQATVTGRKRISPGSLTIPLTGLDMDLSALGQPGFCWMHNLSTDPANYIEYGIFEPATSLFYPLGEMLPGEVYLLRLSRNIQEQWTGSASGTSGSDNKLRFLAHGSAADIELDIFES